MYSARTGETQCLLWFIGLASRQSLLSSDLAAQAPSSTMIMKKSFPLLRAIGLSAGLVASTAMMAPAQAATSGSITATGTIPATCSVTGGSITLTPRTGNTTLNGVGQLLQISSTGTSSTFSLTAPVVTKPTDSTIEQADLNGTIVISGRDDQELLSGLSNPGSIVIDNPFSGGVTFAAYISNMAGLAPGTYTLSSTLSCVAN
jgi:hypothetical protein